MKFQPSPEDMDIQQYQMQPGWAEKWAVKDRERTILLLKRGIWLYFLLLIFEGALRKWVLPSLAAPLLVVRDPVAFALLIVTYHKGFFPKSNLIPVFIITSTIAFFMTLLFGHGNLFVAVYGLRIFLIHVPFMFLVGKIFNKKDVIKIGKVILWIAVPMTILIALQFFSPQSAWVNRGIGGDMEGAGFSGALGYARPPGTFSFTNGTSLFYGLLTPFICYFWLQRNKIIPPWILLAASIGLLAAIPLSISRGLFFQIGISVLFALFIVIKRPGQLGSIAVTFVVFLLMVMILNNFTFFQTAVEAFATRFERANNIEGGVEGILVERFLGGMYRAVFEEQEIPFWGHGLGMGTNVGAMLLSGRLAFLISEGEWGRIIGEMGFFLGIIIILLRIVTVIKMGIYSFRRLALNNLLPWLLFSFSALNVLQGQWSQPTSLGFAVLSGGLVIAALKED